MTQEGELLWTPSDEQRASSRITHFMGWLAKNGRSFASYEELHEWSVKDLEGFWGAVWKYFDIASDSGYERVLEQRVMPGAVWFKGARVNYAEHVLRAGIGRDNEPAIFSLSEQRPLEVLTWGQLSGKVKSLAEAMRKIGLRPGDRVAAYVPNTSDAVVAMLATVAIGSIWSSAAPEFGTSAVVDRFSQIRPKLLFACSGYTFNGRRFDRRDAVEAIAQALPDLGHVVFVEDEATPGIQLNTGIARHTLSALVQSEQQAAGEAFKFERVEHDHPIWILFSSGTTGLPKPIVHSQLGMLISHLLVNSLHLDLGPTSRLFFYTTTGWMMFNSLVSALLSGSSVVTYDGSPTAPHADTLWRLAADTKATVFGASPTYVQGMQKLGLKPRDKFDLSSLKMILLSGSPARPETFTWFYEAVKDDLWIGSSSGGTDICGAIAAPLPTLPVHAGLMQCSALGIDVHAFDDDNKPVIGHVGELVITTPAPCMPLGFWGDTDGKRYFDTYFADIPGAWRHGDFVRINQDGTVQVEGRSDSTLNRHGVRIGTAEIYRCVEQVSGVSDSLVVAAQMAPGSYRMVLFVVLANGASLHQALDSQIRSALRTTCSPRHVPDDIVAVEAIPYTLSGKKMEVPVRRLLEGVPVQKAASKDSMRDPAALAPFEAMRL